MLVPIVIGIGSTIKLAAVLHINEIDGIGSALVE